MGARRSYRQEGITGRYDAVVVGSGIGGLAAASLLARRGGKWVLVLERHHTAGGFTHAFRRPGYEWDVGVHCVGELGDGLIGRVFDQLTDGTLRWADVGEVYDRLRFGDETYELVRGRARFREALLGRFPREREAIDAYLRLVSRTVRDSRLYFMEKALPAALASAAGGALRWPLLRVARRTTRQVLASLTGDARLAGVLTGQYGNYGLAPSQSSFFVHALIAHHFLEGAGYPVGGAGRIAEALIPGIERAGGAVRTLAEVEQLQLEAGRAVGVRLSDGHEVRSPLVVSDAGAWNTFARLLPGPEARGLAERVERIGPSVSHTSLYVGLRGSAAEVGLPRSNLWVHAGFDHDASVARCLRDPQAPLPTVFISCASAKDPEFERRHPGHATLEVVAFAPWDRFAAWEQTRWRRRGEEYEALKQRQADRLLAVLYDQLPHLRGKVQHAELSTPLSTRDFTAHPRGEIYGLAHTPARFDARWLRPRTPIPGLFLTGADVCTAGVAGAMMGGVLCASAILGRNLLPASARSAPARTRTGPVRG